MTYETALQMVEESIMIDEATGLGFESLDYLKAVKTALEKQIPKKATNRYEDVMLDVLGTCICGADVNWQFSYCPICGQRLDWTEYDPDVEQKYGYDPDQDWSKADG